MTGAPYCSLPRELLIRLREVPLTCEFTDLPVMAEAAMMRAAAKMLSTIDRVCEEWEGSRESGDILLKCLLGWPADSWSALGHVPIGVTPRRMRDKVLQLNIGLSCVKYRQNCYRA